MHRAPVAGAVKFSRHHSKASNPLLRGERARAPAACTFDTRLAGLAARLHARLSARYLSPALERRYLPSPPQRTPPCSLASQTLRVPPQPADRTARATCPACFAAPASRQPEPATHAPRHASVRPSPKPRARTPPPSFSASTRRVQPRLTRLLRMPRQPADRTTRTPRHTGTPGTHSGCRDAQDVLRRLGAAPQVGESSKAR